MGLNPNEIFYGPVDLLIVPQVLSLLTPNLSDPTRGGFPLLLFSSLSSSLLLFIQEGDVFLLCAASCAQYPTYLTLALSTTSY